MMNLVQQATIIWPVLALSARMQRVLTYGDLEGFTGILARAQAEPLHLIYLYCKRKGYPLLNSIVVNQDSGFPGDSFPDNMTPPQFLEERARVFTFGWSVKDKPHSEDFEGLQFAATN